MKIGPSLLKFGFALSLLLGLSFSQAAVRCEMVLQNPSIEKAIRHMARLKLKLELAKANGVGSPAITALKHEYQIKEEQVLQRIHEGNTITIEQMRKIFKSEIAQMQGDINLKEEEEKKERAENVVDMVDITTPEYSFVKSGEALSDFASRQLDYSDALASAVYKNNEGGLSVYDIASGKIKKIPASVKLFFVSKTNSRHVWVVSKSWDLQLIDLQSGEEVQSVPLKIKKFLLRGDNDDFDHLDFDSSEGKIALGGCHGTVVVFDTFSGELIVDTINKVNFTDWIKGLRFANDDTLVFNGHYTIHSFDIPTKHLETKALGENVFAVDYNKITKTILVNTYKQVFTILPNLEIVDRHPIFPGLDHILDGFQTNILKEIPQTMGVFMNSDNSLDAHGIYDASTVGEKISSFSEKYSKKTGRQIQNITFSQDSETAVILNKENNVFSFDIWKRHHISGK